MCHLFYCNSLQATEIWVMMPKVLVYGHVKLWKSKHLFISSMWRAMASSTAMQYLGFLKFPLSMALEDIGSEVVLS